MPIKDEFFNDEESASSVSVKEDATGTVLGEHGKYQRDKRVSVDQAVAKEKTNAVRCLQFLVILILVGAASVIAATVYLYVKQNEETAFEKEFKNLASRLGKHKNMHWHDFLLYLDTFANTY